MPVLLFSNQLSLSFNKLEWAEPETEDVQASTHSHLWGSKVEPFHETLTELFSDCHMTKNDIPNVCVCP